MKRVQHKKSACDTEKAQHEKSPTWRKFTQKKCNTKKVKHEKSAQWKEYNVKKDEFCLTEKFILINFLSDQIF